MLHTYCKLWATEFIKFISRLLRSSQFSINDLKVTNLTVTSLLLTVSRSEVTVCVCVYCYHCYCVGHSPAAQRATSSAPFPSSHRSSGDGRTDATGWEGTGSRTWQTDYCPLWPWYLQQITRQNKNEKLEDLESCRQIGKRKDKIPPDFFFLKGEMKQRKILHNFSLYFGLRILYNIISKNCDYGKFCVEFLCGIINWDKILF